MDRDLFLAILAMDSYNRGYGFGIDGLAETGTLGTATLLAGTEEQKAGWEADDFYAIAYDWNGETIISYRGTDDKTSDFFAFGIGAGQPFSLTGGLTDQARLTIEFYRAVAGAETKRGKTRYLGDDRVAVNDNMMIQEKEAA